MCQSTVDIQPAAAEIRRGKKRKKKIETTGQKYNGPPIIYGGHKKSPKIAIWAPSHNFVGRYLRNKGAYRQSEKNLLSSNMSSRRSHNMVNFGPLTAEIGSGVWGTPAYFNGFASGSVTARQSSSERQPNCAALNRGRHLYSAERPSRWASAHISSSIYGRPA